MQDSIGAKGNPLKIASLIQQDGFARQFEAFNRTQFTSAIDSFLRQERSIPSTLRIWLKCSKMRFVPLAFSKRMILRMLRRRASRLLYSLDRKTRRREMIKGRKLIRKTEIMSK